ncbi:DUF3388 domain-containing protein [Paenactinomyces guangxiensis]|uniref:DUF3388 domain-containing protein n=1 Tax=Paenactinomyces guangxiensis TaxID=1490290 RepID=A0A7W2A8P0_9BACL|nr:DUF3388 domain-containing protein [Paenactinomyces guangxiensis]MBA4494404.1 DUF3388 domain-containing protein [Paenactinomyces guangxiensis]MBH8591541.1 DUF3388 domain-containing protein [Paenactinomyces guangxiensis]
MDRHEWYLEYQIHKNRPGLLGDIASLLGMLSINILTINGVEDDRRGMLLRTEDHEKIEALKQILTRINNITITALRPPKLVDRMAVRHGRYLDRCLEDKRTYRFTRDELGLLVDFMAELFKKDGHQLIGVRGMPRVGKTESVVASSVCANKRWTFVSSTLLRQTVRSQLAHDEMSNHHVYIIDGIVSTLRSTERHDLLVREIIRMNATKVIEHPDVFVSETEFTMDDFHYIIELRNHPDETITYDVLEPGFDGF